MITKEALKYVKGLKNTDKLQNMLDNQWQTYVNALNSFIDEFPSNASKLRSEVSAGSFDKIATHLSTLSKLLYKIHADDIAGECTQHANMIRRNEIDKEELEAYIENFIQVVSSLSIDIQMAERKSAASAPKVQPQARTAPVSKKSMKPLILAVDNAVMYLNTLKRLLKDSPYDLHCCETSDETLDFISDNKPDVFLLDVEMPDMDGYTLAKRIRANGQRAPIIFITAHSDREYVDKAIEVGAAGLLVKPLRIKQLLEKLEEVM